MVIDTSVIAAIACEEPEAVGFHQRIVDDPVRLISAATVLEAAMVAAMVVEARLGKQAELTLTCGCTKPRWKSWP